jgi:D-alanyl-D-alanine carboxypeptidase/D-alanyl-D-alanine-endopeptidase (penicillin-binding protein 4)
MPRRGRSGRIRRSARSLTSSNPESAVGPSRRRTRRIAQAALGVVVVGGLGAGGWVYLHHRSGQGVTAQAAASVVTSPPRTVLVPRPCTHVIAGPTDPVVRSLIASWSAKHPATAITVWRTGTTCPIGIASHNATMPLLPASNEKLLTSTGALLTLGPAYRFTTRLETADTSNVTQLVGGTLAAPVTLVGSGDPLFATYAYAHKYLGSNGDTLNALAAHLTKPDGTRPALRKITGALRVNASVFDGRAVPPAWSVHDLGSIQPLSGAASNQDFAGDAQNATVANPVRATAQRLKAALRGVHIATTGAVGSGPVPDAPITLSEVSSPPLTTVLRIMNVPSDDFIAEQLVKTIGAQVRTPGTSTYGIARVIASLRGLGVLEPGDRMVDGSGLARGDRETSTTLALLLLAAQRTPSWGAPLIGSLPSPGQGTLKKRMAGLTARVHAKTGTLNDVSALSGVVHAANGKTYTFSIICNGLAVSQILAAHNFQDAIVRRLSHGVSG